MEELKKQKKSRPLTLTASIVNLVLSVIIFISGVVLLIIYGSYSGSYYDDHIVYQLATAIVSLMMLMSIVVFCLSVIMITRCKDSVDTFPKGIAITLFVFDILWAICYFVDFVEAINAGTIIADILLLALVVMCSVFIMIDVCQNYNLKNNTQVPNNVVAKEQQHLKQEENTKSENREDQLLEQIIKLQKMKESGMITAQEFNKLKTKLIDEY